MNMIYMHGHYRGLIIIRRVGKSTSDTNTKKEQLINHGGLVVNINNPTNAICSSPTIDLCRYMAGCICLITTYYDRYLNGTSGYLHKTLINFNFTDLCSEVYTHLYRICSVICKKVVSALFFVEKIARTNPHLLGTCICN